MVTIKLTEPQLQLIKQIVEQSQFPGSMAEQVVAIRVALNEPVQDDSQD